MRPTDQAFRVHLTENVAVCDDCQPLPCQRCIYHSALFAGRDSGLNDNDSRAYAASVLVSIGLRYSREYVPD